MRRTSYRWWVAALALGAAGGGCGGDARVELAASDSVKTLADAVNQAVGEYHAEIEAADDVREAAALAAFIDRTRRDAGDSGALDQHAVQFAAALGRVRSDRGVEQQRYLAARQHAALLHETADGLRRIGLAGLQLEQGTRQVLEDALAGNSAAGKAAP
jgi:hypothetical protein